MFNMIEYTLGLVTVIIASRVHHIVPPKVFEGIDVQNQPSVEFELARRKRSRICVCWGWSDIPNLRFHFINDSGPCFVSDLAFSEFDSQYRGQGADSMFNGSH